MRPTPLGIYSAGLTTAEKRAVRELEHCATLDAEVAMFRVLLRRLWLDHSADPTDPRRHAYTRHLCHVAATLSNLVKAHHAVSGGAADSLADALAKIVEELDTLTTDETPTT